MTQYPNDPGLDRQRPVQYAPVETFPVVTEDTFADAMALQTKYSYEAARQLSNQALSSATAQCDSIIARLKDTDSGVESLVKDLACLREQIKNELTHMQNIIKKQGDEIQALRAKDQLAMDGYDYTNLVNQIVGVS